MAILRSFKRRLYFQVLRGMCLQVYLYAMYRGNVIAGRPPPASAASYGARLRGYGTGQASASAILPIASLPITTCSYRCRTTPSVTARRLVPGSYRRKAGSRC